LRGLYFVFAAGTGIIPFLDLIAFTLRYAVYKISRNHFNKTDNVVLYPEENNLFDEMVSNDFQLHVYATFANRKSAIFVDVCEQLLQLDQKYNLNIFKFHLKISSEGREKWNEEFLKKNLNSFKNLITKVFIVGPIGFMDEIKKGLINADICANDKVFLV
jgi:ferredoxin-NADP reductase